MENIIDNLFNTKEDETQTITEVIQENISESSEETCAENAQVEETVSVEQAREELHKINNEMIADELEEEKKDNVFLNFDIFIGELRSILNRHRALDIEMLQMKREIEDLIQEY